MLSSLRITLACATLLAGTGLAVIKPAQAAVKSEAVEVGHPVHFDVLLPLSNRDKLEAFVADLHDPASSNFHKWLTPKEFGLRFGPNAHDMAVVKASLEARGFKVTENTRSLHVIGTSDQVERNFGMKLQMLTEANGVKHIAEVARPVMPAELAKAGAEIWSFSPHIAHTMSRVMTGPIKPQNRFSDVGGYFYDDLKQAYSYPSVLDTITTKAGATAPLNGTGASIGVMMDSDVYDADIQGMFDYEGYSTTTGTPDPTINHFYVSGGSPTNNDIFEASLDTQQEIGGAPGASVTLYDIPDLSDGSILDGYTTIDEYDAVSVVSSSFGGCELDYTPQYNGGQSYLGVLMAEHELFLQGNSEGISFLASSGDSAGKECTNPSYFYGAPGHFIAGVSTPAADPNVTAVGGTNLVTTFTTGSLSSIYDGENAWSDPEIPYSPYGLAADAAGGVWGAGGGYSRIYTIPSYQVGFPTGSTTARAVPDVGMQVGGCPGGIAKLNPKTNFCDGGNNPLNGAGNSQRSYVYVAVEGYFYGLIGTSVSSPEFAGATALLVEKNGPMGNLNTYLYKLAANQAAGKGTYFHTNIQGYNGVVNSLLNSEYSLSVGVGTPIVSAYVGEAKLPVAGTPQTTSNP